MARSRSRAGIVGILAASALFLGACGVQAGDGATGLVTVDGPGRPAEGGYAGAAGAALLRRSAEATADASTSKMSMSMSMTGVPMMGDVHLTSEGEIDTANRRSHITMDMGDLTAMLGEGGGKVEMIVDGNDAYVRSDLFNTLTGEHAEWFHTTTSELSGQDLSGAAQSDPTQFLRFLEESGAKVEEVGTEDVRGTQTRHLHTEIDLAALAEKASPGQADELKKTFDSLGLPEGTSLTLPTDVWVDADGLLRRFQMVFDFSSLAGGTEEMAQLDGVKMTLRFELWGFGEPVDITIPPADQVTEMDSSMLGGN